MTDLRTFNAADGAAGLDERVADASAIMDRLLEEFRSSHGKHAGVGGTVSRQMDAVYVGVAQHAAGVLETPVPHSHRKWIGRAIELFRRFLWKMLTPIFRQQTEYNRTVIEVLTSLMRDRDALIGENKELWRRIETLEDQVKG